jgi:hypothetical protein
MGLSQNSANTIIPSAQNGSRQNVSLPRGAIGKHNFAIRQKMLRNRRYLTLLVLIAAPSRLVLHLVLCSRRLISLVSFPIPSLFVRCGILPIHLPFLNHRFLAATLSIAPGLVFTPHVFPDILTTPVVSACRFIFSLPRIHHDHLLKVGSHNLNKSFPTMRPFSLRSQEVFEESLYARETRVSIPRLQWEVGEVGSIWITASTLILRALVTL